MIELVLCEFIEAAFNQLVQKIRRLRVQRRFDTEFKLFLKSACAAVPRRTGERETTLENCRLTRMISLASVIPSK
jgi:hypothetical protein